MKLQSRIGAFIVAALLVDSTRLALNAENEFLPLQSVAETICSEGQPFPKSRPFNNFELEVPFLILTVGSEMTAVPARQCRDFRPLEIEPFYLVVGHRSAKATTTFYVTSLRGRLIQAVHGITSSSGNINFVDVTLTHEVRAEFEVPKAFWLARSNSPLHEPPPFGHDTFEGIHLSQGGQVTVLSNALVLQATLIFLKDWQRTTTMREGL